MATPNNDNELYLKGLNYFKNNDFINARHWLTRAYLETDEKELSLIKLLNIDLKEGKYNKVRNLLQEQGPNLTIEIKQIYGLLESIENNFESSKKYYSECMQVPSMQNKSLLALAKLYIQMGDYEIARNMLKTLQLNKNFYVQSTFNLVCLNILEHNYKEGKSLLENIDEQKLPPKLGKHYYILNEYLDYFLGQKVDLEKDTYYLIGTLDRPNDKLLIKHIKRHFKQSNRYGNGCFLPDIDLEKLIALARDRISNMNANHFELSDMYRFRLDEVIGYKEDETTKDLCVVTRLGTKNIVTMYPVTLSREFDKEGMIFSEELRLKRSRGEK